MTNFDEFTGTVQHRLELPDTGRAVRATRATLSALGARLPADNAADLAASLPMEVAWYLTGAPSAHGQRFDWAAFVDRVADTEETDRPTAAYHAQVLVDYLAEQVPESDFREFRDTLPDSHGEDGWGKLFGLVDAGGWRETHDTTDESGRADSPAE